MTGPKLINDLDQIAADWVARQDRGMTDKDEHELRDWRQQDDRHEGAYMRAQAAWVLLDRARALPATEMVAGRHNRVNRRFMLTAGAGIAAAGAGLVFGVPYLTQKRYSSGLGEIRRVPLSDGSSVTLNTLSRVRVRMTPLERSLVLESGEALFEVAKDSSRPFTVLAGSVKVQAVGTAFNIIRAADAIDVMITEGTVDVWDEAYPDLKTIRAKAGDLLTLSEGRVRLSQSLPEAQFNRLAWRSGQIIMDGEPLLQAVQRFNRFNKRTLRIDPRIADLKVVGNFKAQDPEGFAEAISAAFDLRVQSSKTEIVLRPS
ncbi:FecR domain-containing protein [Asticcacaulis sp. ZE23SCel15]|uniref:FecR family protein n=1 Tax=Asticcacaulis sp. ZE23SCel15 TaxID=3059027 RepID=UPI002660188C|nr:FecR domain-containing protein [Asticcacaulis sp. ZE23SCel15]WKL56066.1 FecR domain-containing protein [Asticcacaulis sp. ZE23SCel15]